MRELSRTCSRLLFAVILIGWVTFSVDAAQPLPLADEVLRKLVQRAQSERPAGPGQADGYYLCTKKTVTEEMDTAGHVTNRKVKVRENRSIPVGTAHANEWTSKNGISLDAELLQRFRFTVVKREIFNGRPTLQLTFAPRDPPPPVRRLQDHLLNRTIGTVWVDEQEYELAKAVILLGESVSFGILGAVHSFHFSFERARSADGNWLTRWTDTTVKARKFVMPIQTRKRVDWTGFRKLEGPRQ